MERGQAQEEQEREEEGEEEAEEAAAIEIVLSLSLTQTACDHSQPHTDFPPNERGVRKCNFSVCLLTDSLWRFLLGCGVGRLPSPSWDRSPGV